MEDSKSNEGQDHVQEWQQITKLNNNYIYTLVILMLRMSGIQIPPNSRVYANKGMNPYTTSGLYRYLYCI